MFVLAFFLPFFPSARGTRQREYGLASAENDTLQQGSPTGIGVKVWISLSNRYGFFDLDIRNDVRVDLSANLKEKTDRPYVISVVIPFSLTEVTNLPEDAYYTYGFWGYPLMGILTIHMPGNVTSSTVKLWGHTSGSSVLWRNVAEVDFLNVTSSLMEVSSYQVVMVPPPSRLLRVYSRFYPDLDYDELTVDGQREIIVSGAHPMSPVVVLYEPDLWEPYAVVVMFMTPFVVFLVPYILKSDRVRRSLSVFSKTTLQPGLSMFISILKRTYRRVRKLDSSDLMRLYVLCALLMLSLSFITGPDPRLKVYILASTQQNAAHLRNYVEEKGDAVALTVYDEMTEFKLLSDLGMFSTVVVGDFYPPTERLLKSFIYPGLDSAPQIIVVESYVFDVFLSEIERRYADKTVVVEDVSGLESVLSRVPRRANALGFDVSPALYTVVSRFVGSSSFILVFLGLAFLACRLIEVGRKPGVAGFAEAIMYSVLYFAFTEIVHTVCTVLLGTPLGLHTSSPKVTAIGFMGFGGGSRPRMLTGLLGFLFGSSLSMKKGLKLDRIGFIAFLVLGFFVLADPLTGGVVFYEIVLLFAAPHGPLFEAGSAAWSYIREFLGTIGSAFGGWVSPVYGISTGIILYVTGSLPICLFSKLERSTATLMLFVCAFCAAQGGIRVAEMTALKTVASLVPGLVSGLIFATVFCLISFGERGLRTYIRQRRVFE